MMHRQMSTMVILEIVGSDGAFGAGVPGDAVDEVGAIEEVCETGKSPIDVVDLVPLMVVDEVGIDAVLIGEDADTPAAGSAVLAGWPLVEGTAFVSTAPNRSISEYLIYD